MSGESSNDDGIKIPQYVLRICKWVWGRQRKFLFGFQIIGFLLVIVVLGEELLLDVTTLPNIVDVQVLIWMHSVRLYVVLIWLIMILSVFICGLIARFGVSRFSHNVQQQYLSKVIAEIRKSAAKGTPAGPYTIAQGVDLAEIFIPLQFRHNRSLVDYPLSLREIECYRQGLQSGKDFEDVQRALFEAERNWFRPLKLTDRISIGDVWQLLLGYDAVVIQGFPGAGKSTFMERLTLYMALRLSGHQDPAMPEQEILAPLLLPVLIRLGRYARALEEENGNLALYDYIMQMPTKLALPELTDFLQQKLEAGECLILLDGLDEVSNPVTQQKVQETIRICIRYHRGKHVRLGDATGKQNRFLITSRVAGYDQMAFPDYPHITIAELSEMQIEDFLPRWCLAHLCCEQGIPIQEGRQDASICSNVAVRVRILQQAFKENQAIKELAENPLLLTLLVLMQQNGVVLPQQRVELYDVVTRTLLEARNVHKQIEPIHMAVALRRLGPLAYEMQGKNDSIIREKDVVQALIKVIKGEHVGGSDEQMQQEAMIFLKRIRERGGLFVQRSGDYFGFMHQTFQEYFAARYILNSVKADEDSWINALVERASYLDNLWREPFLLVVAYQGNENEVVANKILSSFANETPAYPLLQHVDHLCLAAHAVIESKPGILDSALEQKIADQLLRAYERAQCEQAFKKCEWIEAVIQRWLLALPKDCYRFALLEVLTQAVATSQNLSCQRATLTLLTMIAGKLEGCSPVFFAVLLPRLLALTGLPAVKEHKPTSGLSPAKDADVADLALTVLSFLGKSGPAGLLLPEVRQYFEKQPEHLHLLARYSLEVGTLITPCVVPFSETNFQRYSTAIERWIKLRDNAKRPVSPQSWQVEECFAIQQDILACAEEVTYPTWLHLQAMLERASSQPAQPWLQVWQIYLLEQLNRGFYSFYWEATQLWVTLFPQDLQTLIDTITEHYKRDTSLTKNSARHFIVSLCRELYGVQKEGPNPAESLDYLQNYRYPQNIHYLHYLHYLQNIQFIGLIQYMLYLRDIHHTRKITLLNETWRNSLPRTRQLQFWNTFLNEAITKITISRLRSAVDSAECSDLLIILMGRVLRLEEILKAEEQRESETIEQELRQMISIATTHSHDERGAIRNLSKQLVDKARACLTIISPVERDIHFLRLAIEKNAFEDYQQLAELIIRCMGIKQSHVIESPHFSPGTFWEVTLPKMGLRLTTQRAILLLRQNDEDLSHFTDLAEDLIDRTQDGAFIFIMDTISLPRSKLQARPKVVRFTPHLIIEMAEVLPDQRPLWLSRFVITHLERPMDKQALLPYRINGSVTDKLFFGREDELALLTRMDQLGGIIVGVHKSGKSSLLGRLSSYLQSPKLTIIGPITIGSMELQTFFECTLSPLKITPLPKMTPDDWASALRARGKTGQCPVFLLDEIDEFISLDEQRGFHLGMQIRSLHNDGYCKFFFAGHMRIRKVTQQDYSPFKNLTNYVPLAGLQEFASQDLLQIPLREIGFHLSSEQAQRIFRGTAGMPYLIQEFCIRLLCGLSPDQTNESHIKERYIEETEESQDYLNVVYDHCSSEQGPETRCIMLITAIFQEVTRLDIMRELNERGIPLKRSQLDDLLLWLVEFGILERLQLEQNQCIFRILPLYLQKSIMTLDPEQLLEEYLHESIGKDQ